MNLLSRIDYNVQIWREGDQYIAHAMPLDVMSSGSDPEHARNAVDEAVRVFIHTAADSGKLEEILLECGYEFCDPEWKCPSWLSIEKRQTAIGIS